MKTVGKILRNAMIIFTAFSLGGCSDVRDIMDQLLFGLSEEIKPSAPACSIQATAASPKVISELGGEITYKVVLSSKPESDVTLTASLSENIHSDNTTKKTSLNNQYEPVTLTFTPDDWNVAQDLTLRGIDNVLASGNVKVYVIFSLASSEDSCYNGKTHDSLEVTVLDNETKSIVISPETHVTWERAAGGTGTDQSKIYVMMSAAPESNVTVNISNQVSASNNVRQEGTLNTYSLTFTPVNWSTIQEVIIQSVDDNTEDGNKVYTIDFGNAVSTDEGYSNFPVGTVSVTNMDADASFIKTPLEIEIFEGPDDAYGPRSGTINVKINATSYPCGAETVTVTAASSDTTRATVTPASRIFTNTNYNVFQTFTVTSVNNAVEDTVNTVTINFTVTASGGNPATCSLHGKAVPPTTVKIEDDEGPGVRVSNMSRITRESTPPDYTDSQDAVFTVKLNKAPAADVIIPINDLFDPVNHLRREGGVDKASLTFTPANWNTPQTVKVTPANDYENDGTKQYTIELKKVISADPAYNGRKPRNVTVTNEDRDRVTNGIQIQPMQTGAWQGGTSNTTYYGYATDNANQMGSNYAKFALRLYSKPKGTVVLNLATTYGGAVITPATLTFNETNWNAGQNVSVNGASDSNATNETYNITVTVNASSTDTLYKTGTVYKPTVNIRSCDNDGTNQIQFCALSAASDSHWKETSEGQTPGCGGTDGVNPGTATFWIIAQSNPGGTPVNVTLASNNTAEGVITTPAAMPFQLTSSNYNKLDSGSSNKVVVTGVNDTLLDGNIDYKITGSATGSFGSYTIPGAQEHSMRNFNNDERYYITSIGNTSEANPNQSAYVQMCLGVQPAGTVTVTATCTKYAAHDWDRECAGLSLTGDDHTTAASSAVLTFNSSDYLTAKRIYVYGADETPGYEVADGNRPITVVLNGSLTTSGDPADDHFLTSQPYNKDIANVDNETSRAVFVTIGKYNGEMTAAGVIGADTYCNSDPNKPSGTPAGTYKALLGTASSGSFTNKRVATTNGTDSTGQTGWVLAANTYYYLITGGGGSDLTTRLFKTDSNKLFSFPLTKFDGSPNYFSTSASDVFWTGLNANLTTAPESGDNNNCLGWTYKDAEGNEAQDYYGFTWKGNESTAGGIVNGWQNCDITNPSVNGYKLICVQQ